MKRRGLLVATVFACFLTGTSFTQVHRPGSRVNRPTPVRSSMAHASEERYDPLTSAVARRWRQSQPSHWRALLLQH
jgi:hypothetical protein